jgi:YVTN family beta-propeller protein
MAQMPSGAVTFLFTDIEGSTRLVKQLREGYGAVLADHQNLLRGAFAAHGGFEVDTQGDSFFVAFASAREAVLAAVEGQLALKDHEWPEGVEIKVRMGLHTGQAVASDGRYTGLAVHRAARIGAAGHGGQILLSQATQTLLEDEEEDLHVHLQDLGEQSLKDLARPVRLYQAAADGLPESFPPVRGGGEPTRRHASQRRLLVALAIAVAAAAALVGFLVLRGDADGGLAGVEANHVGVIDPETNRIVEQIQVGIRPGPVASGEGFVWVGNLDDETLTRIDPAELTTPRTFPLGKQPSGLAVGLGAVWVTHALLGQVSLVDPQFGEVTRTVDVAGTAFGSAYGPVDLDERSAWVAFGDSTLARLDATGAELGETATGTRPAGVVEADGSVWVTNSGEATVERFNAETFREGPFQQPITVPRQPTGIVYADGAIWVASAGGIVTRIDPNAGDTVQIPVEAGASAIATGADSIWVTDTTAGTISRIDPATNEAVARIETGNAPTGIVFADGLIWVSVGAP